MKFTSLNFGNYGFGIILGLMILTLGFQNCSQMTNFAPTPTYQASTDGSVIDPAAAPLPKTCFYEGVNYKENETIERFQFSSVASTATCEKQTRTCHEGIFDGTFTFQSCSPTAAPNVPQFSLSHVSGERKFTISTQFLSVTDSQCKVQFDRQGTWTTLSTDLPGSPTAFDCTTDLKNLKIQLPYTDNWNSHFINVKVRLVKVSNEAVVGLFPQGLSCGVRAFSLIPTPDIDENCNLQWDDTSEGAKVCKQSLGNKGYGAPYSCSEKIICEGMEATFYGVFSANNSDFYKKDCTGINFKDGYSYGGDARLTPTGTLPMPYGPLFKPGCTKFNVDTPDDSANWVYASPTEWSYSSCEYSYDKKTLYY